MVAAAKVVAAVLLSHIPTYDRLNMLAIPCEHPEDFESNWDKINEVSAVHTANTDCPPTPWR